jgi:hypothetical protein
MKVYGPTGRPWELEFFSLAGSVLLCKLAALDGGALSDGHVYCPYGLIVGELSYGAEMHLVLRDAGMLRRQRLARCAAGVLARPRLEKWRATYDAWASMSKV